ncbi:MAG TPA: hypothetical protein VFJ23_01290 [Candidatus Nitrosotalea sp.]|nr:hypothetical protein [Candidatus Nitrosotalea sp.]
MPAKKICRNFESQSNQVINKIQFKVLLPSGCQGQGAKRIKDLLPRGYKVRMDNEQRRLRFNWKFNLQILEMSTRKIQEGAGGTPKDSRTVFKKISEQYTRSSCSQVKSGSTNQRALNFLSNGPKIEGIRQIVVEICFFK